MSTTIDFLEKIGTDARLRHASPLELRFELSRADLPEPARTAIVHGGRAELGELLGVERNLCCLIEVPDEESGETLHSVHHAYRGDRAALAN